MKVNIKIGLLLVVSIFVLSACSSFNPKPQINYELGLLDISTTPSERRVNVLFQVVEEKNSEVTGIDGLTEEDFEVLENDDFIDTESNIIIDPNLIPTELYTVLLLDVSSSVTDFIQQIKDASTKLVESKLPTQEFAIYTFDKDLKLIQDFTSDLTILKSKINSIPSSNLENSTNLYGSIIQLTNNSLFTWKEEYNLNKILVRNLIVFTDGRHNANPSITLTQTINYTKNKKVYVAALQSPDLREDPLRQIGNQGYFLANDVSQLENKFKEVQDNIKKLSGSVYYLYYTSPISDPSSRNNSLEIKIKDNTNTSSNGTIKTSFNSLGFN
ncbi:MAG: VWA domain-containing protein [Cyclobacteriaceae bacterium]|nr:VWA domain-containing protein [Cyclobacteriaceae bacterium]